MTLEKAEFIANRINLEPILGFIEQQLRSIPIAEPDLHKLLIASEEIVVNIINFAYPETTGKMWIEIETGDDMVQLRFSDKGAQFNPLLHKEGDLTLPADMREPGGLGIVMIKQLVEKVTYDFNAGRNTLSLIQTLLRTHTGHSANTPKVSQ